MKKFEFADTFCVVVGVTNFVAAAVSVGLKKSDFKISNDWTETSSYPGGMMHFSFNVYSKADRISTDNPLVEIQGFTGLDKYQEFDSWFQIDKTEQKFRTVESIFFFEEALQKNDFVLDELCNVIKEYSDTKMYHYYKIDGLTSPQQYVEKFFLVRDLFIQAKALDWIQHLDKHPDQITKCPVEILKYVKPKLTSLKEIGVLDESVKIKSFKQYNDSRVWDLKRKIVAPHNMPNIAKQNDYLQTVKEEITNILTSIYNFNQETINQIQNIIWLDLKKEWQDILDDSLVNWDTPNICAQKCLTKMKEFIPHINEA